MALGGQSLPLGNLGHDRKSTRCSVERLGDTYDYSREGYEKAAIKADGVYQSVVITAGGYQKVAIIAEIGINNLR